MKTLLIVGVTLGMLLVGCGAETEKADSPASSKKQKAENSEPVEKREKVEQTVPGDKFAGEDAAESAAAKAKAIAKSRAKVRAAIKAADDKHEMTLKDLQKMSANDARLLSECQRHKYAQQNGIEEMNAFVQEWADEVASAESSASSADAAFSLPEAMLKKGYSCTFREMIEVNTAGVLGEE